MTTKNHSKSSIYQLNELVDSLIAVIPTLDIKPFNIIDFDIPAKKSDLGDELDKRCARKGFEFLIGALIKGNQKKATSHAAKLKKQLWPTANDRPFKVGDVVDIIRTEHGWEPGYTARINKVHCGRNGIYSYTALVITNAEDQFSIEIDHTRDAHLC